MVRGVALLSLASVAVTVFAVDSPALTAVQRNKILSKHNDLRAQEGSSDIPALKYSEALEKTARFWAAKCTMSHSGHDHDMHADCAGDACGQNNGENLYMASTEVDEAMFEKGVQSWYDEKPDWTYGEGLYKAEQCPAGKQCGHYTQVISKLSLEVGCGYANGCDGKYKSYMVCQYSPGGNLVGGKLFSKGATCSECAIGFDSCVNGLCVGKVPAPLTGTFGWQMMCDGPATEYTLGKCEKAPEGASWAYHKAEITAKGARSWTLQAQMCPDATCSSGCSGASPQELDVCSDKLGFQNKFTYLGSSKLLPAPGVLKNVASSSSSGGDSSGGSFFGGLISSLKRLFGGGGGDL